MPFRSLSEWCSYLSGIPAHRDTNKNTDGTRELEASTEPPRPPATRDGFLSLLDSLSSPLLQSVSRPAMGCEFEVLLNERQYPNGVECAAEALSMIEQMESLLSVYRPQSQISKVNQFAATHPVLVDVKTMELVQLAVDVHQWTGGAFDITAGSLSEAWGFARRQGYMPTTEQIQQALESVGSQHVITNIDDRTITLHRSGLRLNSGGIGKGYALDYAAQHLQSQGIQDFLVHGGLSSIVARGSRSRSESPSWNIALKHPWRSNETVQILSLENQALGTSGSGKQFFHFGGKRYSHLIDPRTGWPADQMMSATVICPSGAVADALATGLFIMGPSAAIEFCESHPEIAAILIYTDPKTNLQRVEHCNRP